MRLSTGFSARLAALVLASVTAAPLRAQTGAAPNADGWRAYPAFNEVTAVASGLGRVWAGTSGGVFSYDPASGEITRTTPIEGLRGGSLRALVVDEGNGFVWAGYADGTLDRITGESGSVQTFLDIARNAQFASRGVRRLLVRGASLYVATDFGVVVFDVARSEVRNTYARFAGLPPATPVNDVLFAPLAGTSTPGLWLATEAGIVTAPAAGAALQSPTAWTLDAGFARRALSLARFASGAGAETVYAGGGEGSTRDLYRREADGRWSQQLGIDGDVTNLVVDGDRLLTLTALRVVAFAPGLPPTSYDGARTDALRGITIGPGGRRWVGDAALGLFPLPDRPDDGATVAVTVEPVVPNGPFTNEIVDLDIARDGTVWAVTARVDAAQSSAVNRLDADTEAWTALLTRDRPASLGQAGLQSVVVGPDGTVYVGTGGDGLVVIEGDTGGETLTRYDETNSSLRSADPNNASFVSVSDVAFERDRRWVANRESPLPMHLFDAGDTWTGLPFPDGTSGGQGRSTIAIDRLGQKWLGVGTGGLVVWDTGTDPASPADDRARQFRGQVTVQTGLPSDEVRDVVVDGDGTVWIGTTRGLATVAAGSAGSVFSADPSLGLPQLTLTPAGPDGQRDFFLRDVLVNDLDVDPAGRVWVATSSGAYLVVPSPDGSGYVVARTLDAASSPLPTDVINRIAVRPGDGRVFVATAAGLFSVAGDATQPTANSEALRASPSPFRPAEAPAGVVVSGLASARSTVRVLTLSGERVYQADVAGGSFRWDGRDSRTGDLVSSGVYIVTAVGTNGDAVTGKIAVIR